MLQITKRRGTSKQTVITAVAVILIAIGLYVGLLLLAPALNLPVVTGRSVDATAKKLANPTVSQENRVYIPSINVDIPIVEGASETVLEKGAWHRQPQNGDPQKGGNFVLSAHRFTMRLTPGGTISQSPFYNIDKLQTGDKIFVDYAAKRYAYEVTKKYPVKPDATYIEEPSQTAKLTLYSCTLAGSADGRDVIEARPMGEVVSPVK